MALLCSELITDSDTHTHINNFQKIENYIPTSFSTFLFHKIHKNLFQIQLDLSTL